MLFDARARLAELRRRGASPPQPPHVSQLSQLSQGGGVEIRAFDPPEQTRDPDRWDAITAPDWASHLRTLEAVGCPEDLSSTAWGELLAAAALVVSEHADVMAGQGWMAADLFKRPDHWARPDLCGLGWLMAEAIAGGGELVSVSRERIAYQDWQGAGFSIWKPGREPWLGRGGQNLLANRHGSGEGIAKRSLTQAPRARGCMVAPEGGT